MSPIESIQPDLAAKLASEDYFLDIALAQVREERLQSEIDQALGGLRSKGGKIGVGVEILMPRIKASHPGAPGPLCLLEQVFRVKENPILNLGALGTGKSAEAIALQLLQVLHGFCLEGVLGAFYAAPDALSPNRDFAPLVACDVKLLANFPLPPLPKLAAPLLTAPGLSVALAGAGNIYFTTDGSLPGPGNLAAQLYSAPFAVASGTVVRTAAYAPNFTGSDVLMATIN